MTNILNKELLAHKFINSSNSSIKRFGYSYFHQQIQNILIKYPALLENTLDGKSNVLKLIDDISKIFPVNLIRQLPLSDLMRSNRSRQSALKQLKSNKYLSRKFLEYVKEEEQLFDMRNRLVGGKNKPYISDKALRRVQEQDSANNKFLTSMLGDKTCVESFLEKQDKLRSSVLYQQVKTLEDIAIARDYDFLFITISATPEHHSNTLHNTMYHQWNGESVRVTHEKFNYQFKLHRNYLYRHKLSINLEKSASIKTVEPTNSGCPHYHIVLFCDRSLTNQYIQSYKKYFKNDFANLDIKRFTSSKLKRKRTHNLSYISNYILKHCFILGTTRDTKKTERVIAWRKYNRIRAYHISGIQKKFLEYKKIKLHNLEKVTPDDIEESREHSHIEFLNYLIFDLSYKIKTCNTNSKKHTHQT